MGKLADFFIVLFAILLILTILLQQRGTSLGGAFGGEGNVYLSRRGAERVLFIITILVAVLFVAAILFKVIFFA